MPAPDTPGSAAVWRAELACARLYAAALRRAGQGVVTEVARAADAVERLAGPALPGMAEPTALLAALLDRPAPAPAGDGTGGRVSRAGTTPSRPLRVVGNDGAPPVARPAGPSPTARAALPRDAGTRAPSGGPETVPTAPVAADPSAATVRATQPLAAPVGPLTSLAARRSAARLAARNAAGSPPRDAPAGMTRAAALAAAHAAMPGATVADAVRQGDRHRRGPPAAAAIGAAAGTAADGGQPARAPVPDSLAARVQDTVAADVLAESVAGMGDSLAAIPSEPATAATAARDATDAAHPAAPRSHGAQADAQARAPLPIPALPVPLVGTDAPGGAGGGANRLTLAEDDPLVGFVHRHGVDPSWP